MSPPEGASLSCYSYEADTLTSLLTTTAANLQIRTEVSSVLTTLLNDVETSSTLSTHLVHKSHTAQLQSQLATAQTALEESRALAQHESIRRQQLGDAFLAELAKLSVKLVELEGWRSDHEGRVAEYDQLKRRLEEMTDRAQALELAVQEGQAEQAANANSSGSAAEEEEGAAAATTSADTEDIIGGGGAQKKTGANAVVEEEKADVDVDVDTQANENDDSTTAPPPTATATDTATAVAAAALTTESAKDAGAGVLSSDADNKISDDDVGTADADNAKAASDNTGPDISRDMPSTDTAIDVTATVTTTPKKKKKRVLTPPNPMDDTEPILECVPERVLMTIFASLDAQDILSTAQVSVVMYSRVDVLFGLGGSGGGGGAENGDGGGASGGADATGITVEELPAAAKTTTAATAESTSEPASAAPTAASALGSTLAGGLFSPFSRTTASKPAAATPTPSAKDATSTAVNTTTTDVKTDAAEDAALATENTTPSATGLATATAPTGVAGSRGRGPMLTPELANSMAEKLSRDELAVIISMQKAQKASESDLTKLRNERDDLIAELKGVESVKDFLVAKLRDVERAQRMAESEKEKVARQVVSDQEVIAFLDYRVQELEGGAEIADRAKSRAEQDLQAAQAKATEKTRVLSDMLRFERDQLAASEKEWKATKKVLVKEVKQCRAQIVSLEAERDGLREQNARLREALLSGGKK